MCGCVWPQYCSMMTRYFDATAIVCNVCVCVMWQLVLCDDLVCVATTHGMWYYWWWLCHYLLMMMMMICYYCWWWCYYYHWWYWWPCAPWRRDPAPRPARVFYPFTQQLPTCIFVLTYVWWWPLLILLCGHCVLAHCIVLYYCVCVFIIVLLMMHCMTPYDVLLLFLMSWCVVPCICYENVVVMLMMLLVLLLLLFNCWWWYWTLFVFDSI